MAGKIKGITIEIGGDVRPLDKALGDVNKKSRDLQSELKQVDRLLKLDPKNTDLLAQKQKLLAEAVTNTRDKLDTLKEAEKQVQEQFKRGEVSEEQYRAVQREVVKTEQELKKLEQQLKNTGLSAEQLAKKFKDVGAKLTDVGKKMTTRVTAPIVAAGVAVVKLASDFEDSLAKVSTLADESQVSMAGLREGILDISTASGVAATEVAGSLYDALSSGVETANVLDFVRTNIMLTKAGFTDMSTAVDATTTVLNAYGEAAYDVVKIGDILVKTQDEGKITVDELAKSMGRVIPTASSLSVNIDQLGAAYAIATAKGQNARIATTNLNSMLGEMGKTGSKTDKALREMTNKSFKQLMEDGRTVGDVLGLLNEYAGKAGLSLADMFGSTTAASMALTLLSDGVDSYNSKVDIMNNATGVMAENVEKLLTPSEKMKIALNKIKNEGIKMGVLLLPIVEKLADALSRLADWLGEMDDKTRQTIITAAGIVAAIGPLLMVLGSVSTGISSIIGLVTKIGPIISGLTGIIGGAAGATGGLSAAFAAISGPVGWAIAGIAALTAGGIALSKALKKEVIPEVDLFADRVESVAMGAINASGGYDVAVTSISESTKDAVGAFMELEKGARTSLHNLWVGSTEITKDIADDMSDKYKEMTTQTLAALDERKEEELIRLGEMFKDTSALTEKEQENAFQKADQHWDDKRAQVQNWQDRIDEIWQTAADNRRGITQSEHDEILRLQEQIKEESIRLMSENEVEAEIILERMKEHDTRVTAEMMSEHIKTLNKGRDEAVAAAEDEYDKRLASIIRMRDETGAISKGQADKMIDEAQRTRDETIREAEELRLGALDKMRNLSEDLDDQVDTSTGNILTWWDKLKRWWSGWQPETKRFTVASNTSLGGRVPQYASGTDYHHGGLAIVGERGPELLNLPRGTQVKPLKSQTINLNIDFTGLPPHIDQHELKEYVRRAIKDPSVTRAIDESLGKNRRSVFAPQGAI
ncbi:MAG: phage tail tape measure protein [Firmicutes bacterium]|nr:phage tail tape measure protein [Bacillota bacterium]